MSSKRGSKRELITIDDDEPPSEQPAVKNKKNDTEPIPSQEVLELQKKVIELQLTVIKLEKNFQGACRVAGEAQARVQFLENLVDTKPKVVDGAKDKERDDGLEKKMNVLTKELDDLRKKYRSKKKRKNKLKKTVTNLTNQLEEKKNREYELEKKMSQLTKEFDEERAADRARNQHRTNELIGQLRKIHEWAAEVQLRNGFIGPAKPNFPLRGENVNINATFTPTFHRNAHPTNLFHLHHSNTPGTLSLSSALSRLAAMKEEVGKALEIPNTGDYEDLYCELCQRKMLMQHVIGHFLSKAHIKKARSHGGTVSLAAYQHWSQLLPLNPVTSALRAVLQAAAAVAAVAAAKDVGGATKEVVTENLPPPPPVRRLY